MVLWTAFIVFSAIYLFGHQRRLQQLTLPAAVFSLMIICLVHTEVGMRYAFAVSGLLLFCGFGDMALNAGRPRVATLLYSGAALAGALALSQWVPITLSWLPVLCFAVVALIYLLALPYLAPFAGVMLLFCFSYTGFFWLAAQQWIVSLDWAHALYLVAVILLAYCLLWRIVWCDKPLNPWRRGALCLGYLTALLVLTASVVDPLTIPH